MEQYTDHEDLFKQAFERFEVTPPDLVKKQIDSRLAFPVKSNRKWWLLGTLLLLFSVGIASFFTLNNTDGKVYAENKSLHFNDSITAFQTSNTSESNNGSSNKTYQNQMNQNQTKHSDKQNQKAAFASNKKSTSNLTKPRSTKKAKTPKSTKPRKKRGDKDNHSTQNVYAFQQATIIDDNEHESNSKNDGGNVMDKSSGNFDNQQISKDSSATANASDSIKNLLPIDSSETTSAEEKNKKQPKASKFALILGGTGMLASNNNQNGVSYSSSNAFQFGLDGMYRFKSNMSFGGGINYFSSQDKMESTQTQVDSTYQSTTYDYFFTDTFEIIQDTNGVFDTIYYTQIDSVGTDIYSYDSNTVNISATYRYQSWSLPLLFSFSQALSTKWTLDLTGGLILSGQKLLALGSSGTAPKISPLGVRAMLRPGIRYQFGKFGVSVHSTFLYDFSPPKSNGVSRKNLSTGFGVGLWWWL